MLSEQEMDAAIAAYDRTNCKTDRGLANQEACMQAAFDAVAALRTQADARPVAWMHRDGGAWELSFVPDDGSKPEGATQCLPLVHPAPEAAQALSDAKTRIAELEAAVKDWKSKAEYRVLNAALTHSAATVAEPSKEVYDCSTRDCQCDACCIERGEAGPFNDDEQRTEQEAAQQQAEPTNAELAQAFTYLDERVIALEQAEPVGDAWEPTIVQGPSTSVFYGGNTAEHKNIPVVLLYADEYERFRAAQSGQRAVSEPMVRFCPQCGLIGEPGEQYRDCCPDGSHARVVPKKFAEDCQQLFRFVVDGVKVQSGQRAGVVEGAVAMLKRVKRDLMHARLFGHDTLRAYKSACIRAEGDVEEWLNENRVAIAAAPTPAAQGGNGE